MGDAAMNPVTTPIIITRSAGCPAEVIQARRATGTDGHGPAGFLLILALIAVVVVGGLVLFAGDSTAFLKAVSQPV
jgi:cytochrome b